MVRFLLYLNNLLDVSPWLLVDTGIDDRDHAVLALGRALKIVGYAGITDDPSVNVRMIEAVCPGEVTIAHPERGVHVVNLATGDYTIESMSNRTMVDPWAHAANTQRRHGVGTDMIGMIRVPEGSECGH